MNILIIGASRGLGHALAEGLNHTGRHFYLLSRTMPIVIQNNREISATWIKADLTDTGFIKALQGEVKDTEIDLMIYNAGIWEDRAFSSAYDFSLDSPEEIMRIITVNLTSAILSVQAVLPNLKKAKTSKVILIGSTSGMENNQSREVAYQASKFGLRGLNNALRENFRGTNISSSILNLGDLAVPVSGDKETDQSKTLYSGIPMQDVVEMIECIVGLSYSTLLKEVDMPCKKDRNV